MIVGKKYSSSVVDSHYDVIVIGSGLGGMSTAALMAKAGRKVLVLERHYTAGGFTHSFKRRGYEWDVGVHYLGEVHKPTSALRLAFDAITDGQLEWAKMDDVYDKIIIKDRHYDFVAGAGNFREELLKSFPAGRDQIDAYLKHIRAATRSLPMHFAPRYLPAGLQGMVGGTMQRLSGNYFNRTTKDVMSEIVTDAKLASVLCGQWGDYGVTPAHSSFAMHGVVAQHYLGGANFPVGGASQIAHHIVPVIERAGGAVLVNADVNQIMVKDGRAIGVRMANGDEILSDTVISAAGVRNTFGRLLPEEAGQRQLLDQRLAAVEPSVAHVCLYIGLKGSTEDLQLNQANMWVYRDYDHDASVANFLKRPNTDFPMCYISFPSSKDPAWASHYPGKSTIDVITLAPYAWFKEWQNKPWKQRGADYEEFKDKIARRLLEQVYKQVPQARGKVDYYELSTPLSTAHFSNYADGEVYGLTHTPERFRQSWIKPTTPIKGLHLTGQDILFCGVASALMSGVVTATAVLGPAMAKVLPEFIPGKPKTIHRVKSMLPSFGRGKPAATPARVATQTSFTANCVEVIDATHDVKAFRFVQENGQPLAYAAGQYVTLEIEVEGKKVYRSYTMSSTPTQKEYFEVTVKRVEGGVLSNWMCDQLKVGDQVKMTGPHGKFTCAPSDTTAPPRKLLFLSAGSGVTPMLSMSRWLDDVDSDADVVFFHCARTRDDLIFGEEIDAIVASKRNFSQHISLTRSPAKSRWKGLKGYLDAAMLETIAPDFLEREIYVCGPEGFMSGAKALLQSQGFAMGRLHEESFGAGSSLNTAGGKIYFSESDMEIACGGGQTILEIAEQAGVGIGNACRTGDCGECKVRRIDGDIVMANCDGLGESEIADGYVLTCVASVNGKVTLAA